MLKLKHLLHSNALVNVLCFHKYVSPAIVIMGETDKLGFFSTGYSGRKLSFLNKRIILE